MKNIAKSYTYKDNSKRQRFVIGSFTAYLYVTLFLFVMTVCTVAMHYICGPYYEYGQNAITALIYFGWGLGLIIYSLLFYICGISYIFWLYRASYNMHALSPDTKFKFSPRWNLVSYVIPLICLVWPYEAMKELWQNMKSAQSKLSEKVVGIWWVTFIFYSIIERAIARFDNDGFQDMKFFAIFMIPVTLFGLVSCYQMIRIVKDVSQK